MGATSTVNACHNYGVAAHTVGRCTPISANSPYPLQQYQANNWAPGLTVSDGPSSLGIYSPPDGNVGFAGDVAACAPGRVAVGICVAGANAFDCGGDNRPPGYYAYLLCVDLLTAAPTEAPTTFAPTATPSFAPTRHHCTGGTHDCDVTTTYCAVAFGINAYTCECLNGYIRVNATSCVATQSPTPSPTRMPTALPTSTPTLTPTLSPTWPPTLEPTAAPTIAPTRHFCTGGTSACDLTTTNCVPALPAGSNAYSCECLSGHIRVNATVCVAATQMPTAEPTRSPGVMPTASSTSTSTPSGSSNVSTSTASDNTSSNDKWWVWCLIGFLVAVVLIGVIVASVWAGKNRRSTAKTNNNQTTSRTRYPLDNPMYDTSQITSAMGPMGNTSPPLYAELSTFSSEGQIAKPHLVLDLSSQDRSPSRESSL